MAASYTSTKQLARTLGVVLRIAVGGGARPTILKWIARGGSEREGYARKGSGAAVMQSLVDAADAESHVVTLQCDDKLEVYYRHFGFSRTSNIGGLLGMTRQPAKA